MVKGWEVKVYRGAGGGKGLVSVILTPGALSQEDSFD